MGEQLRETKTMNHRHQQFDWDSERGQAQERKPMTHVQLRLLAFTIGAAGLGLAVLLAWIGS